jgi:uncharacterized protein
MDGPALLAIAADWSHWDAPPPTTVARSIRLPAELQPDIALVVQGVRRCGKSTLLAQLIERYALPRRLCLFLNFEDPRLAEHLDYRLLQTMVGAFEAERGKPGIYLLDEIQRVNGWQRWLRTQLDRPKGRRFVVTGSNAQLLSGEIASVLTGRHLTVELFPFDYDEFRLARPRAKVTDYLHLGGFPAPVRVGNGDGDAVLRTYLDDIVERDVRERVGARSSQPLRRLAQMLFESAGSELSLRRVATALAMATDTTAAYLDAIENAYLAFACPFFAWSARKQSRRNRKWYPIDPGLRRVSTVKGGGDRGKQLECATFLLLRRRYRDVCYWRDRSEVDFVVEHEGVAVPVQVSLGGPAERHRQAVDEFQAAHRHAGEAVFVDEASYARGIPELPGRS